MNEMRKTRIPIRGAFSTNLAVFAAAAALTPQDHERPHRTGTKVMKRAHVHVQRPPRKRRLWKDYPSGAAMLPRGGL